VAPLDFTASLRNPPAPMTVIATLRRACESAHVSLASVQIGESPSAADKLGRIDLNATLRGPYVATKQAIKEVLERFQGATVAQLRMGRGAQPGEVETTLAFSIWSAPVSEGR
jgi:hypothetical protein